jgi:hypothetical protein
MSALAVLFLACFIPLLLGFAPDGGGAGGGGEAGGDSGPGAPGEGGGDPSAGSGAGDPAAGSDAGEPAAPDYGDPDALVSAADAEIGDSLKMFDPLPPGATQRIAPPAGAPAELILGQFQPADVFSRLQLPDELMKQLPGETQPAVARFLADWYTRIYTPDAQRVATAAQEQAAWWGQLQDMFGSEPYQLAAVLQERPDLLQQVRALVTGNGTPAPGAGNGYAPPPDDGLAGIDRDELDEHSQRIFDALAAERAQGAALREQLAQVQAGVQDLHGWRDAREQEDLQRIQSERSAGTRAALTTAVQQLSQQLGFDVTGYGPKFREMLGYAKRDLAGMRAEFERANPNVPFEPPPMAELLQWAAQRAGLTQIAQQRQRQAATSTRRPSDRVAGRGVSPPDAEELVAEMERRFEGAHG